MKICGFQKTTLLDYPEHLAASVFTGGCNFRCPFCHNGDLVLEGGGSESIAVEEILEYLDRRRGILEGICITGGEPSIQKGLEDFIKSVREMGYLVKLDTNGYYPQVLWELLNKGLLDYVAMDIKGSRRGYEAAAGIRGLELARIEESIGILKSNATLYEFRTTVVKGIHVREDFEEIGSWLEGCRAYYLQGYRESENVICPGFGSFSREELEDFCTIAGKYIDKVYLRGVE